MFWFFGRQACGILAPRPGIEPAPPALEGEVNPWTAREVLSTNGFKREVMKWCDGKTVLVNDDHGDIGDPLGLVENPLWS